MIKYGIYLALVSIVGFLCYQLYGTTRVETRLEVIYIPKGIDESNEFWSSVIAGAQVAAKEYDINLELLAPETETDIEGQNRLIEEAAKRKPDALVVSPSSYEETAPYIKRAAEQGIKIVLIDSSINDDTHIPLVATDNFEIGRKLGSYMKERLPKNPRIGLVGHVEGASTAIDRERGIRAGLSEDSQYIEAVVFCDSVYQEAYDVTRQLLVSYPDTNVIAGFNEYSSLGAATAIRDLGLQNQIQTFGIDSSVSQIQMLESGVYQGLAVQNPFNMGYMGIEAAFRRIKGEKIEEFLDSGSKLITKDDIYTEANQKLLFPFLGSRATKKEQIKSKQISD